MFGKRLVHHRRVHIYNWHQHSSLPLLSCFCDTSENTLIDWFVFFCFFLCPLRKRFLCLDIWDAVDNESQSHHGLQRTDRVGCNKPEVSCFFFVKMQSLIKAMGVKMKEVWRKCLQMLEGHQHVTPLEDRKYGPHSPGYGHNCCYTNSLEIHHLHQGWPALMKSTCLRANHSAWHCLNRYYYLNWINYVFVKKSTFFLNFIN